MFELKLDVTQFERKAREMNAAQDELPFALALALNEAARGARRVLVESTWPSSITMRNPSFLGAALTTKFATKRDLRIEISDRLGRASLYAHAKGGTKRPRGTHLAIPVAVRRGAHGVPPSQRPKALIAGSSKRSVRVTDKGIFTGSGGRLRLRYAFARSATIKKDVPFVEDFTISMRNGVRTSFPKAMARAMGSRRS